MFERVANKLVQALLWSGVADYFCTGAAPACFCYWVGRIKTAKTAER